MPSCITSRIFTVFGRPPQNRLREPTRGGVCTHVGGPRSTGRRQRSPCSTSHLTSFSWCPPSAAISRTKSSSHGAPCSRAHCITSRCPPQRRLHKWPYSTGSRAPAPTATPPAALPQRRGHRSPRPTRSCAPAPTPTPPGARPQRQRHMSTRPTDSLLPRPHQHPQVPATSSDAHVLAPHRQSCSRAHASTSRCPPRAAHAHVVSFHGQPCSRAHRNAARCPPSAERAQVRIFHGHPLSVPQANSSADPRNDFSLSGCAPPFPARCKPRDTTAASHGLPTRESRAQSVGSSRSSTSETRSGHSSC